MLALAMRYPLIKGRQAIEQQCDELTRGLSAVLPLRGDEHGEYWP